MRINGLLYVAVFFSERMAYIIKSPNEKLVEDVKKRNMCSVSSCSKYEKGGLSDVK